MAHTQIIETFFFFCFLFFFFTIGVGTAAVVIPHLTICIICTHIAYVYTFHMDNIVLYKQVNGKCNDSLDSRLYVYSYR